MHSGLLMVNNPIVCITSNKKYLVYAYTEGGEKAYAECEECDRGKWASNKILQLHYGRLVYASQFGKNDIEREIAGKVILIGGIGSFSDTILKVKKDYDHDRVMACYKIDQDIENEEVYRREDDSAHFANEYQFIRLSCK